jgi:mono/diheme cytochrome c family protein
MSAATEKTVHGYMAEFDSVPTLLAACRRVRDAGYTKTDAFTPFPVHGIDTALGIKPTVLPWIALGGGLSGTCIALAMQIWMNGIDYQYIISGKPYISLPAFIPVAFELTILLASFGAFFGMLALNGLPKFSNPMFTNSRFDAATDDKFFLYIDAKDPRYDAEGVQRLLSDLEPNSVDPVVDDDTSEQLPKAFVGIVVSLAMLAIIPPLVVARMRVTTSGSPRFHVFYDMDFSPSKDAQRLTTLFADGRTMRPDVPGTISRLQGDFGPDFYSGIDVEALALIDPQRAERLVRYNGQPPAEEPPVEEPAEESPVEEPAEESPVEEPAEEPSAEEPAEEAPGEEPTPTGEPPVEEPAAEDPPAEPAPSAEPAPAEEPAPESAAEDNPEPAEPGQGRSNEAQSEAAQTEEAQSKEAEAEEAKSEEVSSEAQPSEQKPAAEPPAEEPTPKEAVAGNEESGGATTPVEAAEPPAADAPAADPAVAAGVAAAEEDKTPWLRENPLPITRETVELGQQQYNIYCAVCHGQNGAGNGLVAQRATKLLAPNWVPPSSLHAPNLSREQYPDGKLFSTISNGIRKMPGYASQIKAEDRWAIVAYVRALQLSRNASESDVPADVRDKIAAAE